MYHLTALPELYPVLSGSGHTGMKVLIKSMFGFTTERPARNYYMHSTPY